MAGYVLHFPGVALGNDELLATMGLQALAAECGASWWPGRGHERSGYFCSWNAGDPTLQSTPGDCARTWQPLPANAACGRKEGDVWLGLEVRRPLQPRAIALRNQVRGYSLQLGDGRVWNVPALCHLSHVHRINGAGEYERRIADQYEALWAQSEQFASQFLEAAGLHQAREQQGLPPQDVHFTCAESFDFVCRCLALNYRLTPELVSLLGLIDDEAMRSVIKAAIDLPELIRHEKKKPPAIAVPVG